MPYSGNHSLKLIIEGAFFHNIYLIHSSDKPQKEFGSGILGYFSFVRSHNPTGYHVANLR